MAEFEKQLINENKKFMLITQNVDGYHSLAGSQNIIEMHGNIIETRCTKCSNLEKNYEKWNYILNIFFPLVFLIKFL